MNLGAQPAAAIVPAALAWVAVALEVLGAQAPVSLAVAEVAVALVVLQQWAVAVAEEQARVRAAPVEVAIAALGPLAQFAEQTDPFD